MTLHVKQYGVGVLNLWAGKALMATVDITVRFQLLTGFRLDHISISCAQELLRSRSKISQRAFMRTVVA